jgi:catechol 2,3-dioxygenase-like lactoylglutathione lyase family enzyme
VHDLGRSLRFYRDILGFEVTDIQLELFAWLRSGDLDVLLRPGPQRPPVPDYQYAEMGLVLYTDNLEREREDLSSRGLVFSGNDGSQDCPTFVDPDGHWFQLVQTR